MQHFRSPIAAAALLFLLAAAASGDDGAGPEPLSEYRLKSAVIGSAGAPVSDAEYHTAGTLAQPTPIGVATGSTELLYAGFWWKPGCTASVLETDPDKKPAYRLRQNSPNPFSRSTTIGFSLARGGYVDLTVYDVTGRRVRCLVQGISPAGHHTVAWDGRDATGTRVSPGVYFYRLRAGSFETVKKMLILQ